MKKIILQVLSFCTIVSVLIVSLIVATNFIVLKKSSFKINQSVDKIILGHSHTACGFNDSLISNFSNFSNSGESYFYTYFKLVQLLKQNKQIKVVFVSFANNQIKGSINNGIWGEKHMSHFYPKYAPFFDNEAHGLLLSKNYSCFFSCMGTSVRNNFSMMMKGFNYTGEIGGYEYLVRSKVDSLMLAKPKTSLESHQEDISAYNMYYLQKIVDCCKSQNVKIYLVRSPVHPMYAALKNEKQFKETLETQFQSVEFLDFKEFPLTNPEFGDFDHINFKGAKKFSLFFNKLLQEGLLENNNKQQFINKKMLEIGTIENQFVAKESY